MYNPEDIGRCDIHICLLKKVKTCQFVPYSLHLIGCLNERCLPIAVYDDMFLAGQRLWYANDDTRPYVAQPASFAWVVDIYIYGNLFWFGFLSPTRSAIFRAGFRYYLGEKSIWQIFRQYLESRPWRWIRRFIIWNTSAIVWSRKIADHIAVLVSEIMSLVSLCLSRRLVHSAVKNVSFHYLNSNCKWP